MSQPGADPATDWLAGLVAIPAAARANVVAMSREAERAVTEPRDAGAWPRTWRLAVAARLARLNGQSGMARRDRDRVEGAAAAVLEDPAFAGRDDRERVVLAFMDRVAREPRAVTADDVAGLRAAGVDGPDIVRLCELNAFMSYQCRVLAGLRALQGGAA